MVSHRVSHPKKRSFLAAYAENGNISQSAAIAGIPRRTHYDWLAADPSYAAAFEQAGEQAADALADADFIAASREAVPALVATVRELARAIVESRAVEVDWHTEEERCEHCGALYHGDTTAHAPDGIVHPARALVGDVE